MSKPPGPSFLPITTCLEQSFRPGSLHILRFAWPGQGMRGRDISHHRRKPQILRRKPMANQNMPLVLGLSGGQIHTNSCCQPFNFSSCSLSTRSVRPRPHLSPNPTLTDGASEKCTSFVRSCHNDWEVSYGVRRWDNRRAIQKTKFSLRIPWRYCSFAERRWTSAFIVRVARYTRDTSV